MMTKKIYRACDVQIVGHHKTVIGVTQGLLGPISMDARLTVAARRKSGGYDTSIHILIMNT